MRTLILTRYDRLGASSRVRFLQYLPTVVDQGWTVDVCPLFSNEYLIALYGSRTKWIEIFSAYCRRVKNLAKAGRYDLIWLEKEIFPYMPAVAECLLSRLGIRYAVDYDDAWFHRYDLHSNFLVNAVLGRKIDKVMRCSSMVIAGNEYLAERANAAGARRVEILPTVVDLNRYQPAQSTSKQSLVIGWIGSPATSHYLTVIGNVYEKLSRAFDIRFVAIGANQADLGRLPITAECWSEETETQSIQAIDVGIMPLRDSPWERGKCGYKLIQFMACALPVVASPVGVNKEIVEHGVTGFLAANESEWEEALRRLLIDSSLRKSMGAAGRERVVRQYSLQAQGRRLVEILREAAS